MCFSGERARLETVGSPLFTVLPILHTLGKGAVRSLFNAVQALSLLAACKKRYVAAFAGNIVFPPRL